MLLGLQMRRFAARRALRLLLPVALVGKLILGPGRCTTLWSSGRRWPIRGRWRMRGAGVVGGRGCWRRLVREALHLLGARLWGSEGDGGEDERGGAERQTRHAVIDILSC